MKKQHEQEWISLVKEALALGIPKEEIIAFIRKGN